MNHKAKLLDWKTVSTGIKFLQDQKRDQDLLVISCAAFTGCRPGDFTKFRWEDFIDENGKAKKDILIEEQKPKNMAKARGTKAKKRKVFLVPQFRIILEECYARRQRFDGGYLFYTNQTYKHTAKGITTTTANKWLKRIAAEIDLPTDVTNYSFRRTCARRIFESYKDENFGIAVRLTQQFLNHADPRTTMAYIGLMDEEIEDAFSKLDLI